jgi:hypothetical protein
MKFRRVRYMLERVSGDKVEFIGGFPTYVEAAKISEPFARNRRIHRESVPA